MPGSKMHSTQGSNKMQALVSVKHSFLRAGNGSLYNDTSWVWRGFADRIFSCCVSCTVLGVTLHSAGSKPAGIMKDVPLSNPDGMVQLLAAGSFPILADSHPVHSSAGCTATYAGIFYTASWAFHGTQA